MPAVRSPGASCEVWVVLWFWLHGSGPGETHQAAGAQGMSPFLFMCYISINSFRQGRGSQNTNVKENIDPFIPQIVTNTISFLGRL